MYGEGVLVEVDATVGKLAEGSLLLNLGGLDGVLVVKNVSFVCFGATCVRGQQMGRGWQKPQRMAD